MEGERHNTKRQGEADGERSAEEAMVEGRDGRTKEGRGGRAARTGREQTAPAGHFETFAKNASYMGGLREGWIEKHSNKEFKQQNSLSQHTGSTQVRTGAC